MLKDNVLDKEESKELLETLKKFTGSDFELGELSKASSLPIDQPEPEIVFNNFNFCFTGTFAYGTRKDCKAATENAGGNEVKLTNKTDFLVIGSYATDSWKHSSYGRKIEKAMLMKGKGHSIKIVSEENWASSL